jgi:hypothetical protein
MAFLPRRRKNAGRHKYGKQGAASSPGDFKSETG